MIDIRDHSISAGDDSHQAAEPSEPRTAQPYWFRCPTCNFDWLEWLKPSIIVLPCDSSPIDAQLPNKAFASVQDRIKRKKRLSD
jgi:hypothetical protein